jgi:hypothetical protein
MDKKKHCLMSTALFLVCFSCTQGASPAVDRKKEAPGPPRERTEQAEGARQGAREAKQVIAARVNEAEITLYDLIREMNALAPKYLGSVREAPPETSAKIRKEALDNLIFRELAVQESVRQGIEVKPEAVEAVLLRLKEQLGSAEAYQRYLEENGVEEQELLKRIERSRRFELITAREIYGKVRIEEQEIRREYEKDRDTFTKGPSRPMTYEEASVIIRRKLTALAGMEIRKAWEQRLKSGARIKIFREPSAAL